MRVAMLALLVVALLSQAPMPIHAQTIPNTAYGSSLMAAVLLALSGAVQASSRHLLLTTLRGGTPRPLPGASGVLPCTVPAFLDLIYSKRSEDLSKMVSAGWSHPAAVQPRDAMLPLWLR